MGRTNSTDFPLRRAFQPSFGGGMNDAFITKVAPDGSLNYSTYLGGSNPDIGNGIAVDSSGSAYVTGYTYSRDFPLLRAFQSSVGGGIDDAFITKVDTDCSLNYSTYLGGSDYDRGYGIAVDSSGSAYVTGFTYSSDFPGASMSRTQPVYGGDGDAFFVIIEND